MKLRMMIMGVILSTALGASGCCFGVGSLCQSVGACLSLLGTAGLPLLIRGEEPIDLVTAGPEEPELMSAPAAPPSAEEASTAAVCY